MNKLIFCLFSLFSAPLWAFSMQLELMTDWFEGEYSNANQATKDSTFESLQFLVRRFWHTRTDGVWFYVEQIKNQRGVLPYQQRIMQLIDQPNGLIRLHTYTTPQPIDFTGAYYQPQLLDKLTLQQLTMQQGCDIIFNYEKELKQFVGGTESHNCHLDYRGSTHVKITYTLYSDQFFQQVAGYQDKEKKVWSTTAPGYHFIKKK
ncbi:chromophore lyase CpcT/CpeT [Motilimonas cestriensis]|uniref:Chromophore lyase CpcT/CpeT n=1 Tax=Motilimonas cestriensis TaxID=2742685 RepID=A0ABS8WGJ1_9GAMM|nr:chromophore lyase CpcT/CpeT [Motilimonas cestriensis]MCE2596886.1 chromophore lyase CpcT/CpeT [Motilimonas cestriensis]